MNRLFIALALVLLSGCTHVGYYYQAARGQADLLKRRQPVAELLASDATDRQLKQQLVLADRLRRFAVQRLALSDNKTFTLYADLDRRHVVWNVVAAPRFSTAPRTWCFPIAGCVAYKGFFSERSAHSAAESIAGSGDDVFVYGVNAYSTLGWFNDPLLNTFIHYGEAGLAALIFHELAHQVIYFKDDSAFNEAFATALEHLLVEEWFTANNDTAALDLLKHQRQKHQRVTSMVLGYRQKLSAMYSGDIADRNKAAGKAALFGEMADHYQRLRDDGQGTRFYDWWFDQPLNNATLLTVSTYYRLVPRINALIRRYDNLPAFLAAVREQGPAILDEKE